MDVIDLLQRFAELPPATEEWQEVADQLAPLKVAVMRVFLDSSPFEHRLLAASALARFDTSHATTVLPTLIEGLRSDAEPLKVVAAFTCRCLGPLAAQAVFALTALLEDDNEVVVQHSVQALGAIGPASAMAVPALVGLLQGVGPDPPTIDMVHAWAAASALAAIGPAASEAIPALKKCHKLNADGDELVEMLHEEAAAALSQISNR